ncbi:Tat pathway signal protein [Salinarchaeum chitinilyticum]
MTLPDRDDVSRRTFLRAAVAVGGAAGLSACLGESGDGGSEVIDAPTGGDLDARPGRQYGWNDVLGRDQDGNVSPPSHHVLTDLSLVADGTPGESDREAVEDAFRELERAIAWQPEGLVFTVGYTPAYFDRFEEPLPADVDLPEPGAVTYLENPELLDVDTHDVTVHLASDDPAVVLAAEEALLGNRETLNGHELASSLDGLLERPGETGDRRTGFVGPGLPAQRQESGDVENMPEHDIDEGAPFWMGYRSGFQESQATEDYVAIEDGPFAGGTTQHVETLRLTIDTWFDQDSHHERVSKLFSHVHADEERVGTFGEKLGTSTGIMDVVDETAEDARDPGVVGHAQKAAREREDGTPPLLRRDFNTKVAGDLPGVHFLSLQQEISTFERVRRAMAGEELAEDGAVSVRQNNGILQYLSVLRRGNYLVPPRDHRSLPTPNP